ncbi:uncharacterized protein LOC106669972 [Cimex lectularius]|uniref:CUB domain-containing protein n=1 Tax=Cimex lectularius TaxID=79782 RepID=A0A8I6S424_CIMLE|nr:uncharacterized protein LOC106669972 [Cimex lectularius]
MEFLQEQRSEAATEWKIKTMRMLSLLAILCTSVKLASTQALWTPIYVDSTSQVDLWTQSGVGCKCSFDSTSKNCACCVKEGGCPCGSQAPNRCAQCGIQHFCTNMCNMTLDARVLISKSGKSFGQLKSPPVQGPTFCWFSFIPDDDQRVEIQIYRLISVGKFNGTSCEAGFVQLVDGMSPTTKFGDTQICGTNERFTPPVLLFADNGPATLIFKVAEPTHRSQFMAYFSFTSVNGSLGPGFRPRGGKSLDGTECDWMFQESACKGNICQFSSPGYPGVYPPNRRCLYHIAGSSHSMIKLIFKALSLPHSHCNSHFIKVYSGPTTSSPVLTTLCRNRKQTIVHEGPNLLLEFSSGSSIHPFDFNGFVVALEFINIPTTLAPTTMTSKTTPSNILGSISNSHKKECSLIFYGNETRSGHFDSRGKAWHQNCTVMFIGRPNDVIHLSLVNYHLRASACQTALEIYSTFPSEGKKPLKRICSPAKKHARDPSKATSQETFASSGNVMVIFLRRPSNYEDIEPEFVDGMFLFHDQHVDGTLQPDTICDVEFFGHSSNSVGQVRNPGNQHYFWNSQNPIRCSQRFIPAANQSITIKVVSLTHLPLESNCKTECGDGGCRCVPKGYLASVNHLVLTSSTGKSLSCLCSDFKQEWLPVGLRSWSPVNVVYSVAPNSWATKGFHFQADYIFHNDNICGFRVMKQHSGTVSSGQLERENPLNYYYFQTCHWVLDSNVERQLTVDVHSVQNRPCTAWNITLHEYNEINPEKIGALLHTFCPRYVHKSFELPWKLNIIVIRLNAMTRMAPDFTFKWKSQIVRTNTRLAGITPAQPSNSVIQTSDCLLIFLLAVIGLK